MFHLLTITEPHRGQQLMLSLNQLVTQSSITDLVTVGADVFVFIYPFLLVGYYLWAFRVHNQQIKIGLFQILGSVVLATLITIAIQLVIRKDRPETLPGITMILSHVPSISFPSDHATVSMALAIGWFGFANGFKSAIFKRRLRIIAFILVVFSIIMGVCRMAIAVHRPTDILAGRIIGIIGGRGGRKLCQLKIPQVAINWLISVIDTLLGIVVGKQKK